MSQLQSMTGFARATGGNDTATLAWEIKSVNGRGLEARLRLPPGFERLEQPARKLVHERFARGNIQASLAVSARGAKSRPVIDEDLLRDLADKAARLQRDFGAAPPAADGLLSLRGVMDFPDLSADEAERAALDAAALDALAEALQALEEARIEEGAALDAHIRGQVETIAALVARAEADPSRTPEKIRERLAEQVGQLMEAAPGFDGERLHAEAALLAAKADIREEIDRLTTHVAAARSLLDAGGPVGRRLDFLGQEFNREANTLCSKSNAAAVTAIGLELKAVVDQFREQVQNLE